MTTTPDELRLRYLRERVLTASPAQRVAMLYDRLALDLTRAANTDAAGDPASVPEVNAALDHAVAILAELLSSLDQSAGDVADNLAGLYGYLLRELLAVRGGRRELLGPATAIVETLRTAWAGAADAMAAGAPTVAGRWVS
jgi:flagellar protein FliS